MEKSNWNHGVGAIWDEEEVEESFKIKGSSTKGVGDLDKFGEIWPFS